MKINERILTHPSQLNALSGISFFRTSGRGTIRLGGSIAEHLERKQWESELNRYYYACGCNTSAVGLIIGLLVGCAWGGHSYFQNTVSGGSAIWTILMVAIMGAVIGKFVGRTLANTKLKRTIKTVQEQWQVEKNPEREIWTCG